MEGMVNIYPKTPMGPWMLLPSSPAPKIVNCTTYLETETGDLPTRVDFSYSDLRRKVIFLESSLTEVNFSQFPKLLSF